AMSGLREGEKVVSFKTAYALCICFARGVWLLALITVVFGASMANAQNSQRRPDQPPPFKEKGGDPVPLATVVVTPQQRTEEIEAWARAHTQSEGQLERFSYLRFFWPADA